MKFFNHKRVLLFFFLSFNSCAQSNYIGFEQDFENKFAKARLVFHSTYFEKASTLFDTLLNQQKVNALTYGYAAMVDLMLYKDPSQNIEKAKALSRKTDVNHPFTMALCSFAKGDLSDCEYKMKEFLSKYPNNKYGMHILGFTQTDLGRPEEGLKTLTDLINKYPSYYPAYNHIGYAYLGIKQKENALIAFNQFYKSDSLNPSAFDSLAEGLTEVGEYDKAIATLFKAVLIEPNFAYGWIHLGDILMLNGESELAILAYENAKMSANLYGVDFVNSINKKLIALKQ
jgi:tetratricopeptide (TPR) repeat protein